MTDTPTHLLGRDLGPYQLERFLGQGGFAWVFAARDAAGTAVALKVLKPQYARDPEFEARFRHESETAAGLSHPNIIRLTRVGRGDGYVFFAMELCPDSLAARLEREGPLPEPVLLRLAREITRGLGFAHARGVIHRDLKPANVLLTREGAAVLSDFGIARATSRPTGATGANLTLGTPQYLSPEQAQGGLLDQRADFYALGVTLYKAATGELPFSALDWYELARMHVEQPPPPLRRYRPELSRRFERMVLKCLGKHPDDRYRNAVELLADLDERPAGQVDEPPPGVPERRSLPRSTRRPTGQLIAAVALAAMLLLLALAGLLR